MIADIRNEIIQAFPLTTHLARLGIRLRGEGNQKTATRCAVSAHKPDHWCVSINVEKQIWHCNDHGDGGSIIDWLMLERNQSDVEVFKSLALEMEKRNLNPTESKKRNPQISGTYDYTDPQGNLVYQVVRYEPKEFRQRRPDDKGGWIWNMEGVSRLPYRIGETMMATTVVITEGEKDADSIRLCGMTATCNVGGAGKWLDAYSEFLKGKDIIVIPDNDDAGKKHSDQIVKSLDEKALSLKLIQIPAPYKDASDYISSFVGIAEASKALKELIDKTPHTLKPLPVYTMAELESQYVEFVRQVESRTFNLSRFIPSLGEHVRKLFPGEVVVIMSDTGVGKTAIQQAMARSTAPLPTLFFELELPSELMFERFVQMDTINTAEDVESEYRKNGTGLWNKFRNLNHIMVCSESGLSTEQIESFIYRSELKGGMKPAVVFVDYIGLISDTNSRSRYEALSKTAEQMKVIAKRTRTIVVLGTQVARPEKHKDSLKPKLHDAKDSGSIENSSGLVLGAWRPDHSTMMINVLKNSKGKSGFEIECNFDGAKMQLTERAERECRFKTL